MNSELTPEAGKHENVGEFVGYCRSSPRQMRCDEYRRRGLPVGSGVIEGGCKHVVVDRLKESGSRWSIEDAESVMAILFCKQNNRISNFLQWRAAA